MSIDWEALLPSKIGRTPAYRFGVDDCLAALKLAEKEGKIISNADNSFVLKSKLRHILARIEQNEYMFSRNYLRALNRDNWKCRKCGIDLLESKTGYHVHHIDGKGYRKYLNKANNSMRNLISLCASCHISSHNKILDKCKFEGCESIGNHGGGYCRKHSPKEKASTKSWKSRNKERVLQLQRIYRQSKKHKEYVKEYYLKNKDHINELRRRKTQMKKEVNHDRQDR